MKQDQPDGVAVHAPPAGVLPAGLAERALAPLTAAALVRDAHGAIVAENAAAAALLGVDAPGRGARDLVVLDEDDVVVPPGELPAARVLRTGLAEQGRELALRRADGSTLRVEVDVRPLTTPEGDVVGVVESLKDVTARRESERAARFQARLLDAVAQAVIATDAAGRILHWNRAAEELYGWRAAEVVGRSVLEVTPSSASQEQAQEIMAALRAGLTWTGDFPVQRRDGTSFVAMVTNRPLLDETGAVIGVVGTSFDITERTEAELATRQLAAGLEHAALHDDLTGLPNRTLLADRLEQVIAAAARDDAAVSVLFVDLDAFKDINDAEGHLLGDKVLIEVAARLKRALRPGDTVARFGGDEFVVLLPMTDEATAAQTAHRMLDAIREPMELDGLRLHVSASIGVAASPPVQAGALLRSADAAVYDAKAYGRAQVRGFVGELSTQAEERLAMSSELGDALTGGGLRLVYQPVVDLHTGRLLGVEALLRWDHPTRGAVPPSTVVAVAERTGLARQLDAWVLENGCRQFAALLADGAVRPEAYLAVNCTAANVVDPAFAATVRRALEGAGLAPSALVLEVTETGVMNDLDAGVRMLTALTELGIRIAIDDFGTGWSSLTYVKRLPASIIKLDRSFVATLDQDDEDLAIAASVVELGRATGMTVVAEGVENREQLAVLRRLGCGAAQGYLWSPGVSAEALPAALEAARAVDLLVPVQAGLLQQRQLEPLTAQHGLVRLWELHDEGASSATIAAALNKEGFRNPKGQRWHGRSVAAVLGQPALVSGRGGTAALHPDADAPG